MTKTVRGLSLLFATALSAAAEPADAKTDGPVSYYRQVRPLFQQHCQGCHQPAKPLGGFVMTSYADLLKKGDRELPGVAPGNPAGSFLLEQITGKDGKTAEMPKGKDPLLEKDVTLVRKWIAEGAKDDTPATARDPVDAEHPPVYTLPPVLTSLAYSPDGLMLAVSGFHEVLLHSADGDKILGRLVGLSERVQSIAFSPDGKSLAVAGGSPGRFGEIQIWDVSGKPKLRLSVSVTFDTLYGVSWSPDGSKIAFGCADNTLRAIDAATGKQILYQGAHNDWVLGTVFSQDSTYLVSISRDRAMKLTEVATQRFIDNITSITPGALKGGLLAVARNPRDTGVIVVPDAAAGDTRQKPYDELLIGGADGIPRLYKMHRTQKRVIGDDFNKLHEYAALPGRIYSVAFSPDGELFAAGSSLDGAGFVQVYQTDGRKRLAACVSPAIGPMPPRVMPAEPKLIAKFDVGGGPVYTLAFSPDGKRLAAGGFDGVVRLSDPTTGKLIKEFSAVPLSNATQTTAR